MSAAENNPGSGSASGKQGDYHVPVLLKESIDALMIKPDGIYVDCTFGGGGHSRAILQALGPSGKLVAFDQDADAQQNLPDDERIIFVPNNFRHLQRFLKLNRIGLVDGILADLGVSSFQFDVGDRGFSTRFDGPLDMRMDQRQEVTAAQVVKKFSEQQLHKLFEQYGEVTNSKTLAKHIVDHRGQSPLTTIAHFKTMLSPVVKGNPNKYFAQVFQALRIEVNDEMGSLKELLEQVPGVLSTGGRVAIITFHSLEDRIVKNFFRKGTFNEVEENPLLQQDDNNQLKIITKKPIAATNAETGSNPRSRSAKLRVAEKI
ncbi:16S rRNA (cytosine(1402)-N(4))-methyltransferase RsmH [Segetibacter sp. 3557_3]|uniref:16S rRNA (cytosine(1402)-N(4))-methyltransferase RsmH n=1 Tax=Segetibacter sp. 3557_3 TaxID=2547429 RepID=UPI001058D0F6|nr:16S rRNA (cytosine(1402)-N(4))-methyltransferase RsmH [Segetibacter sp. 3557_3]TDH22991.1 16S rRNA (cytosine(1402)-N(4))-methyltransferase RsmH [Segetibacter sp. 3557_3]